MAVIQNLIARRRIKEMVTLENLIEDLGDWAQVEVVDRVEYEGIHYPLYVVSIGNPDPSAPVIGYFGGVHGLEKIGSEVLLAYMQTISELLKWDVIYQKQMEVSRVVFMPIVNPVGIKLRRRSNGNGVDLMRNAPLDGRKEAGIKLYRGHRISPALPWFRGFEGADMEVESRALCKVVREKMFSSNVSVAVDIHSGFGTSDRFWFPYAHTHKPFPLAAEVLALKEIFDRSYPRHPYVIEPMAKQYTTHGDLWDYLSLEFCNNPENEGRVFLPWTLEMGSWIWLKKNPMQIFSPWGLFHPMQAHRMKRTLRRHNTLFTFLHRIAIAGSSWTGLPKEEREVLTRRAGELWYG